MNGLAYTPRVETSLWRY